MKVLDLFCGGGGVSVGFQQAGASDITGVDVRDELAYPFELIKSDVFDLDIEFFEDFHFIWASPPCQAYTRFNNMNKSMGIGTYVDLLSDTRKLLIKTGKPFVIENVPGAPIRKDLMLCGTMFGLGVFRHRFFEIYGFRAKQLSHSIHDGLIGDGKYFCIMSGGGWEYEYIQKHDYTLWYKAMGIDWMPEVKTKFLNKGHPLSEAIPPPYSKYIMECFLEFEGETIDYYEVKRASSVLLI